MATRWGISKFLLVTSLILLIVVTVVNADEVIFTEDFEQIPSDWSPDNGVWEIGVPTSGPNTAHGGDNCAATILDGDYPAHTDSRLIYSLPYLPDIDLPEVTGDEEIHLRFWHWLSYSSLDYGYVQVQVQDGSDWETVPFAVTITGVCSSWSLRDVDLTPYAGKTVKIGFYHTATRDIYDHDSESSGWYIDDLEIIKKIPVFSGTFEDGWEDWTADNCIWEVGSPSVGPGNALEGSECAGTVLDGTYDGYRDSRLVSPFIRLPAISGDEEFHLRFWHWFSFSNYDYGYVQVQVQDPLTGQWTAWETVSSTIQQTSGVWTPMAINLTVYAGQKIRVAFYHTADRDIYDHASESSGWYIDDIQIEHKLPGFFGDFEAGWEEWSADNGIWEIGEPTVGPENCYEGSECAGTVINGNYQGYTDSRLISPTFLVPDTCSAQVFLSYWQWWSYSSYDQGKVQVSVYDDESQVWSSWSDLPDTSVAGVSTVWTPKYVNLTDYMGEKIKIAFLHFADRDVYGHASESSGWYIDKIEFPVIAPEIDSVTYDLHVPKGDSANIAVVATDPCGGGLEYKWDALDGGTIVGDGHDVSFIMPVEDRFCPYRVRVAVISEDTRIGSTSIIKIYNRCPGDGNEDRVVNILDKVLVRNAFGQVGDPGWISADVNCDGTVNILDKVQVRNSFGCYQ